MLGNCLPSRAGGGEPRGIPLRFFRFWSSEQKPTEMVLAVLWYAAGGDALVRFFIRAPRLVFRALPRSGDPRMCAPIPDGCGQIPLYPVTFGTADLFFSRSRAA